MAIGDNITYRTKNKSGYQGMVATTNKKSISEKLVEEADGIQPGLGVVANTPGVTVKLPETTQGRITLSEDLITANEFDVTVNTASITSVTYATSHKATMDAIVAAILGLATVSACTLDPKDKSARSIIFTVGTGPVVVTNLAITLGVSQAKAYTTLSTVFEGWVMADQNTYVGEGGDTYKVADGDSASVMSVGDIHVFLDNTVIPDYKDAVYVIATGAKKGYATNVSTNNIVTGAIFIENTEDADRAVVRVNRP